MTTELALDDEKLDPLDLLPLLDPLEEADTDSEIVSPVLPPPE